MRSAQEDVTTMLTTVEGIFKTAASSYERSRHSVSHPGRRTRLRLLVGRQPVWDSQETSGPFPLFLIDDPKYTDDEENEEKKGYSHQCKGKGK
jgi:hypothetical protein